MSAIRRMMMAKQENNLIFRTTSQVYAPCIVGSDWEKMRFAGEFASQNDFTSAVKYCNVFSDYTDESTHRCWRLLPYKNNDCYGTLGTLASQTSYYNTGVDFANDVWHTFDMYYVGGAASVASSRLFIDDVQMSIRRMVDSGTINTTKHIYLGKTYDWKWFKIWRNNVLEVDCIPKMNNGVVGFYDRVHGIFLPTNESDLN